MRLKRGQFFPNGGEIDILHPMGFFHQEIGFLCGMIERAAFADEHHVAFAGLKANDPGFKNYFAPTWR